MERPTMRYTDTELYKMTQEEVDEKKTTLLANDFFKWSITRLTELINESVNGSDWMEVEKSQLRNYRTKARDKFFIPKLVRGS